MMAMARGGGGIAPGAVPRTETAATDIETAQALATGGGTATGSMTSAGTDHEAASTDVVTNAPCHEENGSPTRSRLDHGRAQETTAAGETREASHHTRPREDGTRTLIATVLRGIQKRESTMHHPLPNSCLATKPSFSNNEL